MKQDSKLKRNVSIELNAPICHRWNEDESGYDWDILFWPGYYAELSQTLFGVCSPAGITGFHKAFK